MSHPYTEYFTTKPTVEARLREYEKRIKALEAQLGAAAAEQTASTSRVAEGSAVQLGVPGVSGTAAPSVSAEEWEYHAETLRMTGYINGPKACLFAAAVKRWYERGGRNDSDEADLMDIVGAFCRGEKLPEVGT